MVNDEPVFVAIREGSVYICTYNQPWCRVINTRVMEELRTVCALLDQLPSSVYRLTQAEYDSIVGEGDA